MGDGLPLVPAPLETACPPLFEPCHGLSGRGEPGFFITEHTQQGEIDSVPVPLRRQAPIMPVQREYPTVALNVFEQGIYNRDVP